MLLTVFTILTKVPGGYFYLDYRIKIHYRTIGDYNYFLVNISHFWDAMFFFVEVYLGRNHMKSIKSSK